MICASIGHKTLDQIEKILDRVEMAEIRLDLLTLTPDEVDAVFSQDIPLVATCRADVRVAESLLVRAVKAGAHYVDLDISDPKPFSKRIAQACSEWGSILMRSYHDVEGTPDIDELRAIADRCRHHDGEVVKIVTSAHSIQDVERVQSLYRFYTAESLVAFAMPADDADDQVRKACRNSRLHCLKLGAPFSYASVGEDDATAPGQIPYDEMYEMVYGSHKALKASGIRVPSSKSYAQRAVLAAALASGKSTLRGFSHCGDSDAALELARQLGATVSEKGDDVEIDGIAGKPAAVVTGNLPADNTAPGTLNVGESGLLARLAAPLACVLFDGRTSIEGEGTLLERSLQGAATMMDALGATCFKDGAKVENGDVTVPFEVCGPLGAGRMVLDGSKSSQMISGAMMALSLQDTHSSLSVCNPTSIPYLYITMDILRKFGVKVRSEMYGGRQLLDSDWDKCTEIVLKIKENQKYTATTIQLEGDWSAAAPLLAAGAIFGETEVDGLDTTSLQADLTILDILMDAGASVSQADTGTITARKAPLQAVEEDLSNCPDLFPTAAVLCAFCQGRSVLTGLHRLVHKESDRAGAIADMLEKMGVGVQIKGDSLIINGESLDSRIMNGRLLRGGDFSSGADHRMVMALKLASLGSMSPIGIDNTQCVAKSFPGFMELFDEITLAKEK